MRIRHGAISIPFMLVLVMLLAPSSSAHVPKFSGGGDSLETATHLDDPLKSWVIYDELDGKGEAHYFSFHMDEGDRLRLQVFTPHPDFVPNIAVMGPGIAANDTLPSFVESPNGTNILLLQGERQNEAELEPFTPASYYFVLDFDWEVTEHGDYILTVFHADQGGKYGMAVGYIEEFTLTEWLTVPVDAIGIHEWEGQNPFLVLLPLVLVLAVGSVLLIWPPGEGRLSMSTPVWRWLVVIAGLLYLGSGFILLTQMGIALSKSGFDPSALVTSAFVVLPLVLGSVLLKRSLKAGKLNVFGRLVLVILGIAGLFAWAGVLIGPVLTVIAAGLPSGSALSLKKEEFGDSLLERPTVTSDTGTGSAPRDPSLRRPLP